MSEYIKTYISLEKLEDTIGVTRSHESKNDRQPMSKKKEDKRTNGKQSITQKTKDRKIRIPQQIEVNLCASEGLAVPAPYVTLVVKYTTISILKQFTVRHIIQIQLECQKQIYHIYYHCCQK